MIVGESKIKSAKCVKAVKMLRRKMVETVKKWAERENEAALFVSLLFMIPPIPEKNVILPFLKTTGVLLLNIKRN